MKHLLRISTILLAGMLMLSCNEVPAYEGTYLDEDNGEPSLFIVPGDGDGYSVSVGIYRLTLLDDGIGTVTRKGLAFIATDANGNPIRGLITLDGDVATVTFTDSTWPLLENGASFLYTRMAADDAILRRVRSIYEDVASRPFETVQLKEQYCSEDWKRTVAAVIEKDEKEQPGEVGFFDADYWVQGQDCGVLSISDLSVENVSDENASVTFTLHNLGTGTPMRILLVKEGANWMVDNFISMGERALDWKAAMKAYLGEDPR